MAPIRGSELLFKDSCLRREFFMKAGSIPPSISSIVMKVWKSRVMTQNYALDSLNDELDQQLGATIRFVSNRQRQSIVLKNGALLHRLANHVSRLAILATNVTEVVSIQHLDVEVYADMEVEHKDGTIELIRFKSGKPFLKQKARTAKNMPLYNKELNLLLSAVKQRHPGKVVKASFYHLGSDAALDYGKNEIISLSVRDLLTLESVLDLVPLVPSRDAAIDAETEEHCGRCPFQVACMEDNPMAISTPNNEEGEVPIPEKLSDNQRDAIYSELGFFRVNATAGSGKTTVLGMRVVNLLESGDCEPKDILLITFTNKGAEVMRRRVQSWMRQNGSFEPDYVDNMNMDILTFHAWSQNLVNQHFDELGYDKGPQVIGQIEQYDLLTDMLETEPYFQNLNYENPFLKFGKAKGAIVQVADWMDTLERWSILHSIDSIIATSIPGMMGKEQELQEFYNKYQARLRKDGFISFQGIINGALILMRDGAVNPIYQHIMVDEYQDTDDVQFEILKLLMDHDEFKSLMVVGDDSQSIFGFRNTNMLHFINLEQHFEELQDIKLMENWRSTRAIVDLANKINELNKNKVDKEPESKNEEGKNPTISQVVFMAEGPKFVAKKVRAKLKSGRYKANEVAVIARTKKELLEIKVELDKLKIPSIVRVPTPFVAQKRVQVIIHLAKFFRDGFTSLLLPYLGYLPQPNASVDWSVWAKEQEASILKEWVQVPEKEQVNWFKSKLAILGGDIDLFVQQWPKYLDFSKLVSYLEKLKEYNDTRAPEPDATTDAVTLITVHSAKGKEWEVVVLCLDGFAPRRANEIEEERRTLFVAVTRARKELDMIYSLEKLTDSLSKEVLKLMN
jgi:superfamily I DNA/RNA helicase